MFMNRPLYLLFAFLVGGTLTWLLTPMAIRLAARIKAIDHPDKRKVHDRPIPRLGGVAVAASFAATVSLLCLMRTPASALFGSVNPWLLLSASGVILAIGVLDDIQPISPGLKLIFQTCAASFVYFSGVGIFSIGQPFGGDAVQLGVLSFPVTVFWILAVTNAINLIDGLDGLAAGTSAIVALVISFASLAKSESCVACLGFALAGSLLGFLRFNFHPARVFLGDSGSLFAGFSLAVLTVVSPAKESATFAIAVPFVALGLPILDTSLAICRRLFGTALDDRKGKVSVGQLLFSIAKPDRNHIHHRLLGMGIPYRRVVLFLYGISFVLGFGAIAIAFLGSFAGSLVVVGSSIGAVWSVRRLDYGEIQLLKNGFLLKLLNRRLMESKPFQVMIDAGSITFGYFVASTLVRGVSLGTDFLLEFLVVGGLEMLIIYAHETSRIGVRSPGVADALKLVRSSAVAALVACTPLVLFRVHSFPTVALFGIMNFFLLVSCLIGTRFSFRILQSFRTLPATSGKPVLIHGTGPRGIAAFKLLQACEQHGLRPIGFLDEDPSLEGKNLLGYPIFGGHWKIAKLVQQLQVKQILVTEDGIKPALAGRLQQIARWNRIDITTLSFGLTRIDTSGTACEKRVDSGAAQQGHYSVDGNSAAEDHGLRVTIRR